MIVLKGFVKRKEERIKVHFSDEKCTIVFIAKISYSVKGLLSFWGIEKIEMVCGNKIAG